MHTVRTTSQPDRELEVTEQEYTDLRRLGLLAGITEPTDTEQAPKTGEPARQPKTNGK